MSFKIAWRRLAKSGLYRAVRAGAFAYVGGIMAAWVAATGGPSVSALVDTIQTQSDLVGGGAIISGLLAFGFRVGVDPLNVPSLREAPIPVAPVDTVAQVSHGQGMPPGEVPITARASAPNYRPGTGV